MPEVLRAGGTGFVARESNQLVAAVARIDSISRERRVGFEERFTSQVMVDKYETVYCALRHHDHEKLSEQEAAS